ncbi:MAG: DUF2752 domain-containing protein [Myxococcales bacterium]|nr:DUF2752 domain-containing protein [Myxococcales bacterium]
MSERRTLLDRVDRATRFTLPWQFYNGFLVVLGIAALVSAWLLTPSDDGRWVLLPSGARFGDTCAFITVTGHPCPQCGMTRSFVHAARLHLLSAFTYSPGGLGLFLWIEVAAVIGAIRLVRRDPLAATLPWRLVVGWSLFWMVGLYALPWILRLFGVNPLP